VFARLESGKEVVAGDRLAWEALIAALDAERLDYGVHALQARPFAVEFGPQLTEVLSYFPRK
jgi:hypothetical protein